MSLSGNLDFVPLDEVLRLLRRSEQHGCVDVRGGGVHGRVFMGGGGIDIATTYDDDDLHRHLVNSGFSDESVLHRISTGETTLAAVAESNQGIVDLIREMTVEGIHQMSVHGDEFYVHEGATTQYASPKSFDLEALLRDATERGKEWKKVSEVIPDLERHLVLRRELGERGEVTVKADDWKVMSNIGTGASVRDIAEALGTTEFWTARVAARLATSDLVDLADREVEPVGVERASVEPARVEPAHVEPEMYVPSSDDRGVQFDESERVAETPPVASEVDPNESWWKAPEDEEIVMGSGSSEDDLEGSDLAPESSEIPLAEPAADAEDAHGDDADEDTETFLEKVFSELDSSEPDPSESDSEEGHGLLRRRRMGTLRDFSSDS